MEEDEVKEVLVGEAVAVAAEVLETEGEDISS